MLEPMELRIKLVVRAVGILERMLRCVRRRVFMRVRIGVGNISSSRGCKVICRPICVVEFRGGRQLPQGFGIHFVIIVTSPTIPAAIVFDLEVATTSVARLLGGWFDADERSRRFYTSAGIGQSGEISEPAIYHTNKISPVAASCRPHHLPVEITLSGVSKHHSRIPVRTIIDLSNFLEFIRWLVFSSGVYTFGAGPESMAN